MIGKFSRDCTGAFATTAAVAAVPLLIVVGMAIDVSNSMRIRSDNQNALDAAVLSAILEPSEVKAKKKLAVAYKANGGQGETIAITYLDNPTGRSISATGAFDKHNDFMGIMGQSNSNIAVSSKAVTTPALFELKLKPVYGRGTYNKIMYLFDTPPPKVPVEIANIRYSIVRGAASGSIAMTPSNSKFILIKNPSTLYFTMEIDPTSEYIYADTVLHLATNDPATSHHLFVDGKQLPVNTAVNIANYVPCGKTSLFEWEDGGNFSSQDFGFEVTGNCKVSATSPVALVK